MAEDIRTPPQDELIVLRRNLTDYFSEPELQALCADLGVDYASLRGQGRAAKARALVKYLDEHGRLEALIERGRQLRPNVVWGETPQAARGTRRILGCPLPVLIVLGSLVLLLGAMLYAARLPAGQGLAPGLLGRDATSAATETPAPSPATPGPTLPPIVALPATATPGIVGVPATATTPGPATSAPAETSTALPTSFLTPLPLPALPTTGARPAARTATLLDPATSSCTTSPVVTFRWTGVTLRAGEQFVVRVVPSTVKKSECTSNYGDTGFQVSGPLTQSVWTTDISAPPAGMWPACAGQIEWFVLIRDAAGNITPVSPGQTFIWSPLGCKKP